MTKSLAVTARPAAPSYALFLAIFFTSGFAALLYQTIWQRLLTFFSGADVFSVTLIVSAFMGGLGFGSLAGGQLADGLSPRGRFVAFALAELAISAFASGSAWIFYDVLFLKLGTRAFPSPVVAFILFLVLLWPTFFMGLSLPLLSRAFTDSATRSADRIGGLYAWNTLGAAVGAAVTVWGLARTLGFAAALQWGALLNLGCAAVALLAGRRAPAWSEATPPTDAEAEADSQKPGRFGAGAWMLIYGLSGFVALSLEILWFRLLGTLHKASSFTFSTLLAVFLAGLGLGALVGRPRAGRSRRPAAAFLLLQSGIGLYAGLSLTLLVALVARAPWLRLLWQYLGAYETLDLDDAVRAALRFVLRGGDVAPYARELAAQFFLLYGAVPLFVIGPPTLLMGASFPYLQKAVQTDLRFLGRRVGRLQTANIVGSMLGSGVTGLFLLHTLGTAASFRLLLALSGSFLLLFCRARFPERRHRRVAYGVAALGVVVAMALVPPAAELWARLHGTSPDRILFAEDRSGLSVLKEEADGLRTSTVVYVDGLGQSRLPYGSYHTLLGALPVLLHPRPATVMAIGLGSGDTVFALGARPETERLDCAEIVVPQLLTLRRLDQQRRYAGLDLLLRDGRVRYAFADGRSLLMRTATRYDVIEADALRPGTPYVGNLYSYEYFQLVRRRLKPGGYGVTWAPTARVQASFVKAFPHVLQFGETLLGSSDPIPFDPEAMRTRMNALFTRSRFARAGVDLEAALAPALERPPLVIGPDFDRSALTDFDSDLFPKDEYLSAASFWPGARD